MTKTYETVLVETDDGITTVTMNRPDKKNAMNPKMHEEMSAALEELEYDEATRVLILTGAGESFSAGMDLKQFFYELEGTPKRRYYQKLAGAWPGRELRLFPKPTIAMVNGWCFGGAFTPLACCDLAIAAEEAVFGLSEVNVGIFPGGLVTQALKELLRPRDFMYLALTAEQFDGKRAVEIGLVNKAVPRARLREETMTLARVLKSKNAVALRQTKDVFRHGMTMDWDQALAWAAAKHNEMTLHQKGEWMHGGVLQFVEERTYRPGLGAYDQEKAEAGKGEGKKGAGARKA